MSNERPPMPPVSERKWTPEPWYAHGAFIVSDQGGTDERVNIYDTDPSTRDRIVSCVNACANLDPAAIPALVEAAQAVLDRWDTPKWKDAEPTAAVMARLRAQLAAVKGTQ